MPYILDWRIQEFYDHIEGVDLLPFNPFHLLKWLGKLVFIFASYNITCSRETFFKQFTNFCTGLKLGQMADLGEMLSKIIDLTQPDIL